jgi:hypothetical protein
MAPEEFPLDQIVCGHVCESLLHVVNATLGRGQGNLLMRWAVAGGEGLQKSADTVLAQRR